MSTVEELVFSYLDKEMFSKHAPLLFSILHGNMSKIAPTGDPYETDLDIWCKTFGAAFIHRAERQIVLITLDGKIIGFFGYLAADGIFSMEEIQLLPAYQGKNGIFRKLYRFVRDALPHDISLTEAYAHKKNEKSVAILQRLGLRIIGENQNGTCYHFQGAFSDLLSWLDRHSEQQSYNKEYLL